jgi:hypothetical protein
LLAIQKGRSMHKQRAQTVVEFAILAPVFTIILLGVIGFGRVFYAYIDIANEARAGARCAATQSTCVAPSSPATYVVECPPNGIPNACRFTVTRPFDTLTYFLGTNGVITISASATMPTLS